jgi:hypothetical protein
VRGTKICADDYIESSRERPRERERETERETERQREREGGRERERERERERDPFVEDEFVTEKNEKKSVLLSFLNNVLYNSLSGAIAALSSCTGDTCLRLSANLS